MEHKKLTAEVQPHQLGQRLDQTLAELFPEYSRSRIKTWIEAGLVQVDDKIVERKSVRYGTDYYASGN